VQFCRWGFATHGGVDGFSRLIVYLHCTTSNSAQEVLTAFASACLQYNLPSRVRSDHGSENLLVGLLMNVMRGENRGSFITGRSVHNQRIERMWRDVHKEVTSKFYNLFYAMEDSGRLQPDNSIHRYALQKVYLPQINVELQQFRSAWNNHRLRTVRNKTPNQVWTEGFARCAGNGSRVTVPAFLTDMPSLADGLLHRLSVSGINHTDADEPAFNATHNNVSLSANHEHELDGELNEINDITARYEWCVAKLQGLGYTNIGS
jgi:hypothetical protein